MRFNYNMAAHNMLLWTWLVVTASLFNGSAATFGENSSRYSECGDGFLLPKWTVPINVRLLEIIVTGLVHFIILAYIFVGIAMIVDRFMAAIEVITSREKEMIIQTPNGLTQIMNVRIWNESVSNQIFMALGSSAPKILLPIIDVMHWNSNLGSFTIVGSAAFNMFITFAVCVWSVPCNDHRKIKHLRMFFVTMMWSTFAYVWLYLVLVWSSHGVIEVWEGIITFLFFPTTIFIAYIADRKLFIYKYLSKNYRVNKRGVIVGGKGDKAKDVSVEMGIKPNGTPEVKILEEDTNEEDEELKEHRYEYIELLRELRRKNPNKAMEDLELMAREDIWRRGPKSGAFYRLQATKKLTGGINTVKKNLPKIHLEKEKSKDNIASNVCRIFFDPADYTVTENVGEIAITVVRLGDVSYSICVDFKTEDGTALAGSDYEPLSGTIVFRPSEGSQQIFITIIDDDIFEEDEHFYVRLSNVRYFHPDNTTATPIPGSPGQFGQSVPRPVLEISTAPVATITILDDDHCGIFGFTELAVEVQESCKEFQLKVSRSSGVRGRVMLPFRTVENTAKPNVDYNHIEEVLIFENNESWKEILIPIVDQESYERDAIFYVELGDPQREEDYIAEQAGQNINDNSPNLELSEAEKIALCGKPKLADNHHRIQLRIKENKEFKDTVDKLFKTKDLALAVETSSWKEQFLSVVTVNAGDDNEEKDGGPPKRPSYLDYFMHFFTVFWKFLFAFVPPTNCFGGWPCFVISIVIIGLLTTFVSDLASHLGCHVGLHNTVIAICIVAVGTSIPDTLASKVAAVNNKHPDSFIGNVIGGNAVNVFLGIGTAWSIAAIYHAGRGSKFQVHPDTLAFLVILFCLFAFISFAVLLFRRNDAIGGELGGPMKFKLPTVVLFAGLWCLYVLMSILQTYGVINGL